ncbi:MAG: DUF4087 domain-containing protein [Massilia sp.]|nr:DUF4087 domain-containing protein [Aquabacterium sp.]MBC7701225.1 DUF4087 domain-containing protein [Aquabacterium sp.]
MCSARFKANFPLWLAVTTTLLVTAASPAFADGTPSSDHLRTRCGWFDNPSPGNATLTDRDAEWTVAQQGTSSTKGQWPTFKRPQWVRTGSGTAGYGCACLKVRQDAQSLTITHIIEARTNALSACRRDKALMTLEPFNSLKNHTP